MERWNELIAGYVLGNLTAEEQQELAQVLTENPRLTDEIERLKMTATVRGLPAAGRSLTLLASGSEGWSDTALSLPSDLPVPNLAASNLAVPNLAASSSLQDGLRDPYFAYFLSLSGRSSATATPLNRLWRWVLLVALAAVCIDNCRVRRSLFTAREKIIQLEAQIEPSISPKPFILKETQ